MDIEQRQEICPVCTLYLRPGITLKAHLASHPKHKVIEALVRLSNPEQTVLNNCEEQQVQATPSTSTSTGPYPVLNTPNFSPTNFSNTNFPGVNHSIIYQQFLSSSSPHPSNVVNISPTLNQQYITVPTVFNPQMMCPPQQPYVFQQQQVIMSSGPRPLSIEMPSSSLQQQSITEILPSMIKTDEVGIRNDDSTNYDSAISIKEVDEENDEVNMVKVNEDYQKEKNDEACQTVTVGTTPATSDDDDQYVECCDQNEIVPENSDNDLNFIDMDGMKLVLSNDDFMASNNQIISQIDDNEWINRPRILMTIGGMDVDKKADADEEEEILSQESLLSRENVAANIRTDERMPARGELSGQEESNGGSSDIVWCKIQYNNDNTREGWEQLESCSDAVETTIEDATSRHESTRQSTNNNSELLMDCANKQLMSECATEKKSVKKEKEEKNFDKLFKNSAVKLGENEIVETVGCKFEETDTKLTVNSSVLCTICNEILPSIRQLKEHKLEVHKLQFKYKCSTCDTDFQTEPSYTNHLKIHPLECKLCGKLFYRKQGMQLHLKRHLGIKPYKCDVCSKSFLTKQKHDEHKNIHTGECPIKCNLCDETFRRYSNLIQHRNRHHLNVKKKLKDFVCCNCGDVFHSKKKLAWHKEIHEAKPKACSHCSEKFIHTSSLTRHMRRAHNEHYVPKEDRSVENVECPICKGVYLKTSLEMHVKNHSGQRPYVCLICNKDFTTKWNLKLHKWTHAARTSKPFKCDQCKGAFIRQSDYIAHMNSHKSVRPYTCNYCGAQFIRKYNCQRHVREHEKSKTYACQVCDKKFHRSYYLKDHMRIHSGVRPFSCNICGKTSTTKSNHNKHVRIHHAREPVSTEN